MFPSPRGRAAFLLPLALGLSAMLLGAHPAHCQQEASAPATELDIESQPLAQALKNLAEQADLQIVFLPDAVARLQAPAVKGSFTPEQALRSLLAGTSLEYLRTDRDVYVVRVAPEGPARAQAPPAQPVSPPVRVEPERETTPRRDLTAESRQQPSSLGDLMVTGTHLRGMLPVGAQVITIDREDFERMGFATLQDVIRTLPQNFGGGATEDTLIGLEAGTNTADGTALNLRGLGSSSTLILINGRRLAGGGSEAAFTDISNIPLTAIERIDVLPDGASAFYGSDAVGGVVNLILRDDYAGAETQARAGAVTEGSLDEYQAGQVLGGRWGSGNVLVALEYYRRDNLPADDRAQAASDLRRFGGTNFDTRNGNPGTIVVGAQTWAIPRGQDGTSLTPVDFVPGTQNLYGRRQGADLLPEQERVSLVGSAHQELGQEPGKKVDLFFDALYSRREFEALSVGVPFMLQVNPSNPFYVNPGGGTGPILVAYNFGEDLGRVSGSGEVEVTTAALGASSQLAESWRVTGYGSFASEEQEQRQRNLVSFDALVQALNDPDPATAFNPFGDGSHTNPATLDALRTSSVLGVQSRLHAFHLVGDGPLFALDAGEIKLALGADHRRQSLDSSNVSGVGPGGTNDSRSSSRSVTAAFGELLIPLFSGGNRMPGLERLHVSLAGRYEKYSDFGEAAVPAAGIVWEPLTGLALRATWSESFKAPSLADLDESQNGTQVVPLPDSDASTGLTSTLLWFGKNADLNEETARSWTLGAEIAPPVVPGLTLGLTYFDIEYNDRIEMSAFSFADLADPSVAGFLTRAPTAADRERACSRSNFFGNPADCRNAPVGALLDLRIQNIALNRTSGLDLLGTYTFDAPIGELELRLNGTYLFEFSQATIRGSPLVERLDTQSNPLNLQLRSSVTWQRSGYQATAFLNYADDYRDTASQPNRRVGSWTTFDLQLGVSTNVKADSPSRDLHFFLGVQNVFDTDPPFLNSPMGIGYDAENADLLGRIVRFHVRKHW